MRLAALSLLELSSTFHPDPLRAIHFIDLLLEGDVVTNL
jgi:hypothetical protein